MVDNAVVHLLCSQVINVLFPLSYAKVGNDIFYWNYDCDEESSSGVGREEIWDYANEQIWS
jgi:hypothetical protein